MIYSMTGFGKSAFEFEGKKLTIEIRSLNSKSLDLSLKLPYQYKSKEIELRKVFTEMVGRGKVDCYYNFENFVSKTFSINKEVVSEYIKELKTMPESENSHLLSVAMKLPEVLTNNEVEVAENEWNLFLQYTKKAITDFNEFRKQEGMAMKNELMSLILNIELQLTEIAKYEAERIEKVRERLQKQLKDLKVEYDEQRFHQELIYYIEKQDITEEKVRLSHHLKFFIETLKSDEIMVGKKLGFISQEIGREINTLGSKANHNEIQKLIVQMKDDLEKIKEQSFNVL